MSRLTKKYGNEYESNESEYNVWQKLGQLEDICEDIIDWTDGCTENTDTIIITFKSSEKLLELLEELL